MKLNKGINSCTNEEYHSDKSYLSSTSLKKVLKDPGSFYKEHVLGEGENKSSNAFDEGTYAHSLILEPETVEDEFAFFTGWRKAGKEWEAFKAANEGKVILSKPQKARVEQWVQSYTERPEAVKLISGGMPEHTLTGELKGVPIKVRADYINVDKGYIADVKTTAYDPEADMFKMVIKQFSYDLSAALYRKMFSDYYGKDFDFYFIVLGKKEFKCEVYKASDLTLMEGMSQINKALDIYKKCSETGIWKLPRRGEEVATESTYEILEV